MGVGDKAAEIAHKASADGGTLKAATLALGYLDEDPFDLIADPISMTSSGAAGGVRPRSFLFA